MLKDLLVLTLKYGWPLVLIGALAIGAFYLFVSIVANNKEIQ